MTVQNPFVFYQTRWWQIRENPSLTPHLRNHQLFPSWTRTPSRLNCIGRPTWNWCPKKTVIYTILNLCQLLMPVARGYYYIHAEFFFLFVSIIHALLIQPLHLNRITTQWAHWLPISAQVATLEESRSSPFSLQKGRDLGTPKSLPFCSHHFHYFEVVT